MLADSGYGAVGFAGSAIYALVGVNNESAVNLVNAVYRTISFAQSASDTRISIYFIRQGVHLLCINRCILT